MRLWIFSDLHCEKRGPWEPPARPDFDVLVCAGDVFEDMSQSIGLVARLAAGRPAIFVPGNHEYWHAGSYAEAVDLGRSRAKHCGIHFLEGDTVEIDGVRFAGATLWEPGFDDGREGEAKEPRDDVARASETAVEVLRGAKADVVVTHYPPDTLLWYAIKAPLWICGHTHGHGDVAVNGCRQVRNALGYPGEDAAAFRHDFVVAAGPSREPAGPHGHSMGV